MRIRGLGRFRNALRQIRGRIAPGPTILIYHRVNDVSADPQLLSVTPAHFEEHLEVLSKFYRVLPLNDLAAAALNGTVPRNAVAITFDDGYANNYDYAWPLLKKYSIPATIFVTTGYVSSHREFFCDELERVMLRTGRLPKILKLNIAEEHYVWQLYRSHNRQRDLRNDSWTVRDAGHPTPAHKAYRDLHCILRNRSYEIQEQVIHDLRTVVGDSGSARRTHRALSWEQIRTLAVDGLVDIGAHTVNHVFLSSLDKEAQRKEIIGSIETIEANTHKKVTSFAYPYGTQDSYDAHSRAIVIGAGCLNASSNFQARISAETDPFQLPRLIVRDCSGDSFHHYLRRNAL